ncbi:hypothetical protein N0V85_007013 [Neurospora sp. IMI 360204]|nr:hypothetical protein N0V85_007013 [Neurospora sp. IMI 360204]
MARIENGPPHGKGFWTNYHWRKRAAPDAFDGEHQHVHQLIRLRNHIHRQLRRPDEYLLMMQWFRQQAAVTDEFNVELQNEWAERLFVTESEH